MMWFHYAFIVLIVLDSIKDPWAERVRLLGICPVLAEPFNTLWREFPLVSRWIKAVRYCPSNPFLCVCSRDFYIAGPHPC